MKGNLLKTILNKSVVIFFPLLLFSQLSARPPSVNFEPSVSLSDVTINNFETTRITFTFEGLNFINVETCEGTFTELIMPGGYSTGDLGTPGLPASKRLIEIPFGAEVNVRVISYTTEKYRLSDFGIENPLMPVQPSLRKDQDAGDVPFRYQSEYYSKPGFIKPELASVEVLGVMRGQRLGRLTVAPVQYNPTEGIITVYNNIELDIQYTGSDEKLTGYIKASTYSPYFDVVYNRVINPFDSRDIFNDYPDLTKYPLKMVIVSHPVFKETLQPFIEWKTIQGFKVIEAYTDEIGNTPAAIQSFIHAQYHTATPESPAPTFVILVGDNNKLPASATGVKSGQVTDLYYASVDGDYFPDMYTGRLSARNMQELHNQLYKIMYYQKYDFDDPSFLNDVTLIAGADNNNWNKAVGQPTIFYGTENYFNLANGFNNVNTYLDNYSGCYDEERISVSMINYTAHCTSTGWSDPSLTVSDIHNMTNKGKYPLAIGNCCQSGLFSHPECVGEAWLRAEERGAVAYIGSAPNTHWFEDFYWAVGAFPIQGNNNGYVPDTAETTLGAYDAPFVSDYRAIASAKFVGNLAITEAHQQGYPAHSNVQWYWEGYHTFGDPSTFIYLTEGYENTVEHMNGLPAGYDHFTVSAKPGSYVGISKNGTLHGAALVGKSGIIDIPVSPVTDSGTVTIAVTKPQYIPYIKEIPVVSQTEPYVILDYYKIDDSQGNNNNQADYGEFIKLDVSLKNIGLEYAIDIEAKITTVCGYLTIIDNQHTWGNINKNKSLMMESAFSFEVDKEIPDNHDVPFTLIITDAMNNEWESNFSIKIYSPQFTIGKFYVDDSKHGNNNEKLDPGETALIMAKHTNTGGAPAVAPVSELYAGSPYLTLVNNIIEHDTVPAGEYIEAAYTVKAHPSAPEGTTLDIVFSIKDGNLFESEQTLVIGQMPEIVIGNGNEPSGEYPFYNYYRANRSQMLYLAGELNHDKKLIHEIAFEITNASGTNNKLPNFVMRMMHTTEDKLNGFLNTGNAKMVYAADIYEMPIEEGQVSWKLQKPFEYYGENNLLVEIIWGRMTNTTQNYYEVACTQVNNEMVAYGYSNGHNIPPLIGTSDIRPNLWLTFSTEASKTNTVNFVVKNNQKNLLENVSLTIGSKTKYTNKQGNTSFSLPSGIYLYKAEKEGYVALEDDVLIKNDKTQEVLLQNETFTVTFNIVDVNKNDLNNAVIIFNDIEYDPGEYVIKDVEKGAGEYKVKKGGFFPVEGTVMVNNDTIVKVTMMKAMYTIIFQIENEEGNEINGAVITFDGVEHDPGKYVIENIQAGIYDYKVQKEGFFYTGEQVTVESDIVLKVVMKTDTYIDILVREEISIYPNPARNKFTILSDEVIKIIKLTDISGHVLKNKAVDIPNPVINVNNLPEGIYFIQIQTAKSLITKRVQIIR